VFRIKCGLGALVLIAGVACENEEHCAPGDVGCSVDAAVATFAGEDAQLPMNQDAAVDVAPIGCPAPNGFVLNHVGDITANETWVGDGTVHRWLFDGAIRPGATLTIAPCALVQVGPNLSISLRGTEASPAKLIARGTEAQPIQITNVPGAAKWGGIIGYDANASVDLAHTTIENGGNGVVRGATINLKAGGDPGLFAIAVLRIDHVTISGSVGAGIVLESGAAFTADSNVLRIQGGGVAPGGSDSAIDIGQIAVSTLPTLQFSGNARDQVRISAGAGSLQIARDTTIKNRGVPYYFYFDRVRVFDPTGMVVPTLTIEAGVEIRFDDYMMVGNVNLPGKVIAAGTAAQPVVFTSAKPVPSAGDWPGLWLRNAPGSRLENVRIDFAGGPNGIGSSNCKPSGSNDNAGLLLGFDGSYVPSASDFFGVTVSNSASHGINAMWIAAAFGPDLTAGITFVNVPGCRQTKNGTPSGCMNVPGCLVP
jgi:hypothetical protein